MTEADADVEGEDVEEQRMPLIDHLIELRKRLFHSLIALLITFVICFYFANPIFDFLVAPLADLWQGEEERRLIYTALHEKFFTNIKVAFFAALFFSFPLIAGQVWLFVAPGLYKTEKGAFLPFRVDGLLRRHARGGDATSLPPGRVDGLLRRHARGLAVLRQFPAIWR